MAPPVKLKPPTALDMAMRAQVDKDRMLKRPTALAMLQQFQMYVDIKALGWEVCARNFGTAYTRAAKNHLDALAKVDKVKALTSQGMFSALALLMTGPTSMLWNTDSIQAASALIKNTLKDLLLTAFTEATSAIGPPAVALPPAQDNTTAGDALDDLYKQPLECENVLLNQVAGWKIGAYHLISDALATLQRKMGDDRFWDDWSESQAQWAIDSWKNGDGNSVGAEALWGMEPNTSDKDIKRMATELERAMWAKWMSRLHTVSTQVSGGNAYEWGYSDEVGKTVDSYEGVPGPIADRFEALGILKEAGTTISMWHSAEAEDKKLIAWANRFLADGGHPIWNAGASAT
jgi:hypothetical protein